MSIERRLSLLDSTMINVGSMVGSGIFIVPAMIALLMQSSSLVLAVWIVGGIVSLFGALSIAELGVMMPKAGGQYVYLREAYGPLCGFLYGWSAFAVINTASIAAVAVTFAVYLGYFVPLSPAGIKLVAAASVIFLTVINCFGIKIGALVQNGFTLLKIGALVLLSALCLALNGGSFLHFSPFLPTLPFSEYTSSFVICLIAALFSYDGWIEITYVAGEVKDPQRTLPRSLFYGTVIVILLYIVLSTALMYVLSIPGMANSSMVASDAAIKVMGSAGAIFITIAVVVSTFGANNGFIFTCPHIYYAMATEGLFFKWLAYLHPKYRTPIPSLIVQAILAIILILSGTFDQFATYVVFASWIFYAMSAGAVMILRRRKPDEVRVYKTWGYPYTPIVFILFSLYLVGSTVFGNPRDALIGLAIVLSGIPIYFYWNRKQQKNFDPV